MNRTQDNKPKKTLLNQLNHWEESYCRVDANTGEGHHQAGIFSLMCADFVISH